jgi:DeoR/GlpR family transcriptional regulator of sugar metabolism
MKPEKAAFQQERMRAIRDLVKQRGRVTVEELSAHFTLSAVTIRKDLSQLERTGEIVRTHGGAIAAEEGGGGMTHFYARLKEKHAEKQRIAQAAAAMVADGDVIFIDASTTVYEMCSQLTTRHALTVITISLSSAYWLATNSDATIVVVGGSLKRESFGLIGGSLEDAIREWNIGKAFMGCWGLSISEGLTDTPKELVMQKRMIAKYAREVVALADSSKWGNVSLESFCRLEDVKSVISDSKAPQTMTDRVREMGVEVVLA